MRKFFAVVALAAMSMPAFADITVVPEPESIALVGIGLAALLFAVRRKK